MCLPNENTTQWQRNAGEGLKTKEQKTSNILLVTRTPSPYGYSLFRKRESLKTEKQKGNEKKLSLSQRDEKFTRKFRRECLKRKHHLLTLTGLNTPAMKHRAHTPVMLLQREKTFITTPVPSPRSRAHPFRQESYRAKNGRRLLHPPPHS